MKESEEDPNNHNIINDNNDNDINECQHNIKESSISLDSPTKPTNDKPENENTTTTTLCFLKDDDEGKNEPISNLNKNLPKYEESSSNNLSDNSKSDKISESAETESFYQKTKRWAGTIWSYMNIKNYFPKQEFKEYRNSNGDIVRIPKKKLPLKKIKKQDNEEYIINKVVERDNDKINNYAANNIPFASHFI